MKAVIQSYTGVDTETAHVQTGRGMEIKVFLEYYSRIIIEVLNDPKRT